MTALAEKTKAPTVAAAGALREELKRRHYSPKSTASEAQRERIITALRAGPEDEL